MKLLIVGPNPNPRQTLGLAFVLMKLLIVGRNPNPHQTLGLAFVLMKLLVGSLPWEGSASPEQCFQQKREHVQGE